jgi:hypothetical protein
VAAPLITAPISTPTTAYVPTTNKKWQSVTKTEYNSNPRVSKVTADLTKDAKYSIVPGTGLTAKAILGAGNGYLSRSTVAPEIKGTGRFFLKLKTPIGTPVKIFKWGTPLELLQSASAEAYPSSTSSMTTASSTKEPLTAPSPVPTTTTKEESTSAATFLSDVAAGGSSVSPVAAPTPIKLPLFTTTPKVEPAKIPIAPVLPPSGDTPDGFIPISPILPGVTGEKEPGPITPVVPFIPGGSGGGVGPLPPEPGPDPDIYYPPPPGTGSEDTCSAVAPDGTIEYIPCDQAPIYQDSGYEVTVGKPTNWLMVGGIAVGAAALLGTLFLAMK